MIIVSVSLKYVGAGVLFASLASACAQSFSIKERLPMPDPGYGLFYHDALGAPNPAARWGYHDGWTDGRQDRNHGETYSAQEKNHYLKPPDHGNAYRASGDDAGNDSYDAAKENARLDQGTGQENSDDRSLLQDDDDTSRALQKEHYRTPPDHGVPSGILRDRYIKAYRAAYVHGYEHGSRL